MSPPRDERGRFVRADGKPTLHRQVADPCRPKCLIEVLPHWEITWRENGEPRRFANEGEIPAMVPLPDGASYALLPISFAEPSKGSLWPWLFLVGVLALVITGMFAAAVDGGLM